MATTKALAHGDIHSAPSIELNPAHHVNLTELKSPTSHPSKDQIIGRHDQKQDGVFEAPPSAALSIPTLQKWNEPRGNIYRFIACFFTFFVMGLGDAAYGALLPYLERYYNLSYTVVSLIFLCPFAGYTMAAFTNSWVHNRYGQRGIALIAPTCYTAAFIGISLHPPWPVVVTLTIFAGFGAGLVDAAYSTWAGHMVAGNVLEGSLHAFYALGCTFSPLIATSLVVKRGLQWYYFYYMLAGLAAVMLGLSACTFWNKNAEVYRMEHPREEGVSSTKVALRNRVTWLCCAFFLVYVGAEVSIGGWVVSFMLHVRNATPYTSGIVATGFWAGMTLGRSLLGLLTHSLITYTNSPSLSSPSHSSTSHTTPTPTPTARILHKIRTLQLTERSILTAYLLSAIALQLLFWLIPSITASAISVAFLGVALGPVFPSGIIMATKLLPEHLHVPSVGFSTAFGGTGGAVFPFIVGAIAQKKGVQVLQPIILAMLLVLVAVWLCFPRLKVKGDDDGGQEREQAR